MTDYIEQYKNGSGIHIKKKNRGKFTDYCGGKVTEECIQRGKHSSNPTTRKRANFAANARKWKHAMGGLTSYSPDSSFYSSVDARDLEQQANGFKSLDKNILEKMNAHFASKVERERESEDNGWDDLFSGSEPAVQPAQTSVTQTSITQTSTRKQGDSRARGDRNNNWLNLRISNNNWKGKLANNTDGSFEQFETAADGFRAGLLNMQSHIKRGKNTVASLISTWAPAIDNNNTSSYINNVLKRTGIKSDDVLNPNDKEQMINLAYAMAISENGYAPNKSDIEEGWNLISKS